MLTSFNRGFEFIRGLYNELMAFAVKQPRKMIAVSMATLLFNLLLLPFVGTELQPTYDSGEFRINLKGAPGIGLEQMGKWSEPLEEKVMQVPEVNVTSMHLGGIRTSVNEGAIEVKLSPLEERRRGMLEIMSELRKSFKDVGDIQVSVVTNQGSRGDPRPVQIGLRGSDLKKLTEYANDLAEKIRQVPGATDVEMIGIASEPEIVVRLDQLKASQLGLDNTSVGKVVQYAFQGRRTGRSYTIGNNDYDIILQLDKEDRRTIQDVANLRVSTESGTFVRLGDVADVQMSSGPTRIDREGRQRQIAVYANTVGISPGELLKIIEGKLIPELNMDIGYRYKLIGGSDMMNRIFGEIVKAVILAVILIYMVLAAEFESFSQPLVIMMSLPFGAGASGCQSDRQYDVPDRGHYAFGSGYQECDFAGGLCESGEGTGTAVTRCHSGGLFFASASYFHDYLIYHAGYDPHCLGNRLRRRIAPEHGCRIDRRFDHFHFINAGSGAFDLFAYGTVSGKTSSAETDGCPGKRVK